MCLKFVTCQNRFYESGCKWGRGTNSLKSGKQSKFKQHDYYSTAVRIWVYTIKGKVVQKHLSTEDLAACTLKEQKCRLLNHSGAPIGIAVWAAVTVDSPLSFSSISCVAVKLWSLYEADKWWESFWSHGLLLYGLSCQVSSKRTSTQMDFAGRIW